MFLKERETLIKSCLTLGIFKFIEVYKETSKTYLYEEFP